MNKSKLQTRDCEQRLFPMYILYLSQTILTMERFCFFCFFLMLALQLTCLQVTETFTREANVIMSMCSVNQAEENVLG